MSKTYMIRSADGCRSYGQITRESARNMVFYNEAKYVFGVPVVQLLPAAAPEFPRITEDSSGPAERS